MANDCVWTDKKRSFLGLPLSFTRYTLYKEKLTISSGFLNKREEEIRLYRIKDITLKRSLGERMLGLGTIHCCSSDSTTPEFDIHLIKDSVNVKNTLSDMVEEERNKHFERVGMFAERPERVTHERENEHE